MSPHDKFQMVAFFFLVIGVDDIILGILGAIKAVPIIDGWFRMLISAWMQQQTKETLQGFADVVALAQNAQTDEDRYKVSEAWQKAFERPRQLP